MRDPNRTFDEGARCPEQIVKRDRREGQVGRVVLAAKELEASASRTYPDIVGVAVTFSDGRSRFCQELANTITVLTRDVPAVLQQRCAPVEEPPRLLTCCCDHGVSALFESAEEGTEDELELG
jgi:hypothetical protein